MNNTMLVRLINQAIDGLKKIKGKLIQCTREGREGKRKTNDEASL
jgi:hypothetical protein